MKIFVMMSYVVILASLPAYNSNAEQQKVGNKQFETVKSLVGTWEGYKDDEKDKPVLLEYQLSGGGSAVVEKMFQGTPKEMVTVYHQNGDSVMLSHYCMLGNQPRMRAAKSDNYNQINFNFIDGTNMDAKKDGHMHNLTLTQVSADTLKHEWTLYNDGKQAQVAAFSFTRTK